VSGEKSDARKSFLRSVTIHVLRLSPASEQEQLRAIANAAHALANELDAPRLAALRLEERVTHLSAGPVGRASFQALCGAVRGELSSSLEGRDVCGSRLFVVDCDACRRSVSKAPQRTVCGRLCGGGCALCSGV